MLREMLDFVSVNIKYYNSCFLFCHLVVYIILYNMGVCANYMNLIQVYYLPDDFGILVCDRNQVPPNL